MSENYNVTFNIDQQYGYISYNEKTKEITVNYPDEKVCQTILAWLNKEHTLNMPNDNNVIYDFSPKTYLATNSKQDFQLVLTRIWEEINVHIDWSFPSEYL